MTIIVPYMNGCITLAENVFNVCGYLPKEQFPQLNTWSTKWRERFGQLQMITGIALFAVGWLVDSLSHKPDKQKYLTITQQAMSLGILYINHGIFNLMRAYVERQGWGVLTGAYDFYGRKFLPPLAASFDLQGYCFEYVRRQLDRIHFITIFPLEFCLRS